MGITIKDVARLANVSIGTVSMAINGKEGVNEETKRKVLEAVKKLNYRPNHYARSLITNKSSTIGLIVTDVTNPYFGMVIDYIQNETEKIGYNLLLGITNDKLSNEKKSVENLIDRNVEGLIIIPAHTREVDLGHLYNLKRLNIPFVFITTYYEGIQADCVMTDLTRGSYELTNYLLNSGYKKIYYISGYKESPLSMLRINGYKKAYKKAGLGYSSDWIVESYADFVNGYDATRKIIEHDIPDAVITVNDITAMGVLKCLKDNDIKVPDEVSVAGYDDLLFASIIETPLTTVRQPIEEICKASVGILTDRINRQDYPEKKLLLKPELIIRNSTKELRQPF